MASTALPLDRPPPAAARPRFYFHLSLACAAIAVLGFTPTYWAQVPGGTVGGSPLLHMHALTFTAWPLLLIAQTWRAANGRIDRHRAWGMAGISLATIMVVLGMALAIVVTQTRLAHGEGDAALAFLVIPVSGVGGFAILFTSAVANLNRPEWHKRLMIASTVSVLQAAMARFFFFAAHGMGSGARPTSFPVGNALTALTPALLLDLIVVAGIVYDFRTRGRPHPAWLWSLGFLVLVQLVRIPVSTSSGWLAFADWLTRLT